MFPLSSLDAAVKKGKKSRQAATRSGANAILTRFLATEAGKGVHTGLLVRHADYRLFVNQPTHTAPAQRLFMHQPVCHVQLRLPYYQPWHFPPKLAFCIPAVGQPVEHSGFVQRVSLISMGG